MGDRILSLLCVVCVAVTCAAGIWFAGAGVGLSDSDVLYQVSSIGALMEGEYGGLVAFGEIKEHGDFGIGTFDSLDGELIAVNGEYFQVTADGAVKPVFDVMTTPFATVTFFEPDISISFSRADNFSDFGRQVEAVMPSGDRVYAVRATGQFPRVLARSVPRQEEPYPRLVDATKGQSVFVINGTRGTVAGFWFPESFAGLNVPGFHLHYITSDASAGGHILDLSVDGATVELDMTPRFFMVSLSGKGGGGKVPSPNSTELEKVEKSG